MDFPGFQLVKRIIGPYGRNTKSIANASGAKIRVRGRGSRHAEQHTCEEADVALMVAVSCADRKGFEVATQMTSELLYQIACELTEFLRFPTCTASNYCPPSIPFTLVGKPDCLAAIDVRCLAPAVKPCRN